MTGYWKSNCPLHDVKTIVLPTTTPVALQHALDVLRHGGLVAFPTDTVYGLGALAFDGDAVASVYAAKARSPQKSIPVLIGAMADFDRVAAHASEMARRLAGRFWPGPLTLVVDKSPGLPPVISADATVGVRQPNHSAALALLQAAGPMAVSSANLSGQPDPTSASDVIAQLDGRIELVLDGGTTPGGIPSTVADCTGGDLVILREGPLSIEDLRAALA